MTRWPLLKVGDLIDSSALALNDGYRVRRAELGDHGTPFVRGGDIGDGWITTDVEDHVLPERYENLKAKLSQPEDVAFITKGTVGRVGYLREGQPTVVFAPQVCYWRVLDRDVLWPLYVFYLLRSRHFQANLDAVKTHGAMAADYVSLRDQRHFRLPIPPIAEQRRIAAVLGALDDKIELNRQMNGTLERIALAIFKAQFMDLEGHEKLVQSQHGLLPLGWSVVRLGDLNWVSGGTPRKSRADYWGGRIPWISAKSLKGIIVRDAETRVTPLGAANGTRLVPSGSVLFVVRGMSLASEFRCGIAVREVAFNQDLKAIVPTGQVHPILLLLYLRLRHDDILRLADEASHGTKRLQTSVLSELQLPLPRYEEQEALARPLVALFARIRLNEEETETLTALRDTLLPKLISGEVRVPEAEAAVEAAR